MKNIQYLKPKTLTEALDLLHHHGKEAKLLAGGTDLIIALNENIVSCKLLLDTKGLMELQGISFSPSEGLSIGAAVCLNDIIESKEVQVHYPILVEAAKTLANSLLRNRATLVGNLCNASPGGDMLPPCIVLDASLEIASKDQTRKVALKDFFIGVKKTILNENEMVTKIVFPVMNGKGKFLRKSRIKGHDLAQVSVAGFLKDAGGLNITIGAAGPTPINVSGFEQFSKSDVEKNRQDIVTKVLSEIKPIGDQRSSKEYRVAMVEHFTNQVLDSLTHP